MADRIKICSIQVKNFRSIRNETLNVTDFNIFVGPNDVGKSNFLKALNLFFNNQTDYNTPFDFSKDFTYLFPESSHSTKEIKIVIKFNIPSTYKEHGVYIWQKIWRTNNYYDDSIKNENGDQPSPRSRIPGSLKRIKYRYVPAVKSNEYYKTLLLDLYTTVSASLRNPLQKPAEDFSLQLREYTKDIGDNVALRLNMDSALSMPSNMSDIFQALVIMTKTKDNTFNVPLNARGDGIQARHIPIILKYIADEDRKSRNQGSMQVETIWGFEEPENGVELSRAFEMADEFMDYSSSIQIFASTHSPAFYMKKTDLNTEVYYTIRKPNPEGTSFILGKAGSIIGENMGLLPLIAPYVATQKEEYEQIKKLYLDSTFVDLPTIMVEGITDKKYLKLAIEYLSPELKQLIDEHKLRIITKDDGCGTTQLENWAYAWIHSGNKNRLYILFDKDEAGIKAKNTIEASEIFKRKHSSAIVNLRFIEPSDKIIELYAKKVSLPYEIEHLLSIDFWKTIRGKDLLLPRSINELQSAFSAILTRDKTIDNVIEDCIDDINLRDTIVCFNPNDDKKTKIFSLVEKSAEKNPELLYGFTRTIKKIEQTFIRESS